MKKKKKVNVMQLVASALYITTLLFILLYLFQSSRAM